MFRRVIFTVSILVACASTSISGYAQEVKLPADKANFHVFILMGQSNMSGSGMPVLTEYMKPSPNVLLIGNNLKWIPSLVYYGAGMSPGQVFARHYAELHPDVTVGLIQCAKAGLSIKDIAKGGTTDRDGVSIYDNVMAKIREAKIQGTLKSILWHQGESDCADPAYVDKLKALVKDIRTDIGEPDLPFIAGELGRFNPSGAKFNELLSGAKTAIPSYSITSSEGLMDLGDKMNFSGFSVEVLGSRYLMEYLKMKEPSLATDFKPTLADITRKMLAKDAEWQTIPNPSMTEGAARPLGWDSKWMSKGNIDVVRDDRIFSSSPSCLRIESTSGPVSGSISQTLRNVAGRKIRVNCKVMNAGFSGCILSLIGLDSSGKQVLQKNIINAKDAIEWSSYSSEAFVPSSAINTKLLINVNGEGRVWLDDFSVEKEAQAAGTGLAINSSMTEGYDKPLEWTGIWTSEGSLKVAKDLKIFKSPPASLRIDSDGGPVNGSVSQELKDVAGKKVRVKGWVRFKGLQKCSVGVGAFDSSWKMLKWGGIYYKEGGDELDWVSFDKTVDVPANAEKINLSLGITGEGSAWFDDIEVEIGKTPKTPAK
ncbi:MAG: sialate O-acetylesterase [Victivallales bacterium]